MSGDNGGAFRVRDFVFNQTIVDRTFNPVRWWSDTCPGPYTANSGSIGLRYTCDHVR
jgi:hypothetical protein